MATIGDGHVRVEYERQRADIIIDRAEKRNAMNEAVVNDLMTAVERVDEDEEVRAVTLLGEGSVFCAGFQLEMMHRKSADEQDAFQRKFATLLDTIDDMTTPVVAGIQGAGIAGGFELTLPADLRVLGEDARYGVIEVELGIFPHQGSTQRLPRLVGIGKAKEMILTAEYIDPAEADRCNLVTEVVSSEVVDTRAKELADNLTEKAPLGIQHALRAFQVTFDVPLKDGLEREHQLAMSVYASRDRREGFEAQLEGREPSFEGQ
ncbi:enoyl-CoA hydratase/isomerase family protein [Haloglomus irregulare]|jgi:enoyl-CoA hydratase/carnithine racemase|uniref:Enoyl-CoA hydratase/isomerase family protein n=1 Tax=Haloglomus irregulare TaxID=2234134 RepID=A0A554MU13_9EURY|nr:enoyl-CoA hydratase/isomerase family protein [Haloglomus irregulare]TSD08617.1 enoyl-CoA hydratase/isomerase family protein [Haloglomus irregulare]